MAQNIVLVPLKSSTETIHAGGGSNLSVPLRRKSRKVIIYKTYVKSGYIMREIGAYDSRISLALRRYEKGQ